MNNEDLINKLTKERISESILCMGAIAVFAGCAGAITYLTAGLFITILCVIGFVAAGALVVGVGALRQHIRISNEILELEYEELENGNVKKR